MTERTKGYVVDAELTILESKRNAIFEYMQDIYDSIKNIEQCDQSVKNEFLSNVSNIDQLRSEYIEVLDNYNKRLLSVSPTAAPSYQCLIAFEQLYSRIKSCKAQFSTTTQSPTSNPPLKGRPSLPPIELVSFDGDIRSWPLFYASFKSTIHDNPSLTDSERLYYLLGKVGSKAQSVCAGITPSADNYHLILQTLIDKYEDKRMLASTYLNQLIDFKPLTCASANNFDLFLDKFVTSVRALNNLKLDDLSNLLLLQIALKKLDSETVRSFEMSMSATSIPTFENLIEFITNQSKILQRSPASTKKVDNVRHRVSNQPQKLHTFVSIVDNKTCLCKFKHSHLYKCPAFNKIPPESRFKTAKQLGACFNCLSLKHMSSECQSKTLCSSCKSRHHSSLHFEKLPQRESNPEPLSTAPLPTTMPSSPPHARTGSETSAPPPRTPASKLQRTDVSLCTTSIAASTALAHQTATNNNKQCNLNTTVLLATAQVIVVDSKGREHLVRCLLDSASQSNFITSECLNRLGIKPNDIPRTVVKGIGGSEKIIKGSARFEFCSRFKRNVKFDVTALIVDRITDNLPTEFIDITALPPMEGLPLADETFGTPRSIDVLLGAAVFPHLLLPGVVTGDASAPLAVETVLGFVIMGSVPTFRDCERGESANMCTYNSLTACCCYIAPEKPIDQLVKRFWELEELTAPRPQHPDDVECEEFYRATTTRDTVSGRYIVALPFRDSIDKLGQSFDTARKRFLCLERKLESSPELRAAYDQVIRDYLSQGYLTPAPDDDSTAPMYVIPHHGVVREDKNTTKLRIVLDASCKTSSGVSLNDILFSGPNIQGDLFKIILNFRLHAVALTADCKQMFLQLIVREGDRRFQRILYRFSPNDPLVLYQFDRVCFGLKSSPYHALRTVAQLVNDTEQEFPLACTTLRAPSLYMDDVAFSVPAEHEATATALELIQMFKTAQLDLVKWNSNSPVVLDNLPDSHVLRREVEFDRSDQSKVLGLQWSTENDNFYFKVSSPTEKCTKRSILSTVARLWDLMGFVAPTILFAKLLIKQLWQLSLDWDDEPPSHIARQWRQFCLELPSLNELRIPRHLGVTAGCVVTLLGFSDASEHAYGAVVYMHVCSESGNSIRLVCAKSKVAPMKPMSIARLELCAAVLLSQLVRTVIDTYSSRVIDLKVYNFTDSKVVLYWIKSSPHRWQTFVANRVVKLTDNISADTFYHVAGTDNPADCLSRGLTPAKLLSHPLWHQGPPWALLDPAQWPLKDITEVPIDVPERKILAHPVTSPANREESVILALANRCSSWSKLLRSLVFIYRVFKILPRRKSIFITATDLEFVERKLLNALQIKYFSNDFVNLKNNLNCSPALVKLRPFLDNDLIRVGGRLSNSELSFTQRHPIILPRQDHVIDLLIDYYHKRHLHAGPELVMSLLRQDYWILSARRIIRQRVHKCNSCFRMKPRPSFPLMADLPDSRVRQVVKAFTHTGCDYAGPISFTPIRRRGARALKAYICVFTCLTTRAVHIECTTDLSTVRLKSPDINVFGTKILCFSATLN